MRILMTTAILTFTAIVQVQAADKQALAQEGKHLIGEFAKALKGELVAAMKKGGPAHAISVCNEKAPEIADQISVASGWSVSRSSHKLRNPGNEPDDFTRATIEEFLSRQNKGEKAVDMVKTAIVEEGGIKEFRMIKAIPTGGFCLKCHGGAEVNATAEAALRNLYPEDQARGFSVGEMRGVFVLTKTLK